MKITQGSIVAGEGEHIVLTGPVQGTVTLPDGEEVDVSPAAVAAPTQEKAAEIALAVSRFYAENGHPTDPDFSFDEKQSKKNLRS